MADDDRYSRRATFIGAAVALSLLFVGLWLARELATEGRLQDCVMQGRTNYAVIRSQ